MNEIDAETKRKRIETAIKVAGMGLVGFLVAPFIFLAIKGILGMIVTAAICLPVMYATPAVSVALANWRLKLIKAAVAQNPVESLQEEHRRRALKLDEQRLGIEREGAGIRTFGSKIDAIERRFPGDPDIPQMKKDFENLQVALTSHKQTWQDAMVKHGQFAEEIDRVQMLWEASIAGAQARQQSGLSEDEWMATLKTKTAIDSVRLALNQTMSALDTDMMAEQAKRIVSGAPVPLPERGLTSVEFKPLADMARKSTKRNP